MMRGEVSLAESTLVPQKSFLGLLFCQKPECSAKGCRLAYLEWGEGFHLAGATKAGDQTHSWPDTWRPQHQRGSEGQSARRGRPLGGRVNSRGQQNARHRIEEELHIQSRKCTPNTQQWEGCPTVESSQGTNIGPRPHYRPTHTPSQK